MTNHPRVRLKPTKDIPVRAGHPWIFSHALETGEAGLGEIVVVEDTRGHALGLGTYNPNTNIRVRMLTRRADEIIDAQFFAARLQKLDAWKRSHLPKDTDGYRLVHAEADGLPGLIVDRYADTFVFQIHTAGMELLRAPIIEALKTLQPKAIVERSAFLADVLKGQKTGFFLDQRDARLAVGRLAKGRRVLNLFAYTGAFSVHAANGGAKFVTTVDSSHNALELAQKNIALNKFDPEDATRFALLEADVMDLMGDRSIPNGPYDLIVCDPPAFAKSERHLTQALKAYTDLHRACLAQLPAGGILVTSSCSGRVSPEEFRTMLRIAAGQAGKNVRVLAWINQPADHAECLAFPEGRYLKTAVLQVVASS
jgi:23S rRNA (cytosine1962-C5)-methyltransferase